MGDFRLAGHNTVRIQFLKMVNINASNNQNWYIMYKRTHTPINLSKNIYKWTDKTSSKCSLKFICWKFRTIFKNVFYISTVFRNVMKTWYCVGAVFVYSTQGLTVYVRFSGVGNKSACSVIKHVMLPKCKKLCNRWMLVFLQLCFRTTFYARMFFIGSRKVSMGAFY